MLGEAERTPGGLRPWQQSRRGLLPPPRPGSGREPPPRGCPRRPGRTGRGGRSVWRLPPPSVAPVLGVLRRAPPQVLPGRGALGPSREAGAVVLAAAWRSVLWVQEAAVAGW